jgi:TonB family protein
MIFPRFSPSKSALAPPQKQRIAALASCAILLFPPCIASGAPIQSQQAPPSPAPAAPATAPASPPAATDSLQNSPEQSDGISEDALRRQLVGKPLFLRGGYLGDSLSFNEHGYPTGHPAAGSYTLCAVQIDKVHLSKHRVEFEGSRYALHFLGALPSEDPSAAVDRIKITPKKKVLKISIDREQVIKAKKSKEPKKPSTGHSASGTGPDAGSPISQPVASSETDAPTGAPAPAAPTPAASGSAAAATSKAPATQDQTGEQQGDQQGSEQQGTEQAAADQASVTTTISPAHAAKVLHDALDHVFAFGIDEKLRAQMPEFWQLYYQAQAAGSDFRPRDPKVLRSSAVDQQAKLLSSIAPDSNEYAQSSGIVGRALYRAVIGPDGKAGEIAVVRPIGFGLDENAVAAIRKATFQPAAKDGQPVAESLDLAVVFRIFSKRTSVAAGDTQAAEPPKPIKPGPYSVKQPQP